MRTTSAEDDAAGVLPQALVGSVELCSAGCVSPEKNLRAFDDPVVSARCVRRCSSVFERNEKRGQRASNPQPSAFTPGYLPLRPICSQKAGRSHPYRDSGARSQPVPPLTPRRGDAYTRTLTLALTLTLTLTVTLTLALTLTLTLTLTIPAAAAQASRGL